jgi:hypothetical protein
LSFTSEPKMSFASGCSGRTDQCGADWNAALAAASGVTLNKARLRQWIARFQQQVMGHPALAGIINFFN